ncbi:pyrimidine-nucleoside phosphorylase [Schnuerera ultunensis]|uniref:pyrimidine-nucleoside phosphorylase n=1 Tax=Schnuerera ultunensis TaxID=45497 RepID=UPI0004265FD7|nr:pyrimidine-nucleoside phosphorylase [Schnuerera ultunensis]
MRIYDIIKKKRDGEELTTEEVNYFVKNYTEGKIPDYQISALLMAIYFNKMNKRETIDLTRAMVNSGDIVDLSGIKGIKVDKHSTGGVGDTVTLILGPMIAACDVPFVKMSGRGLGHTGGTLDKLESINGFRVELTNEEFLRYTNNIKISICSQTANITPADKKLYSLRDVTATVENLSLIASSIMSKKLAIGSDAIILDVKVGNGAFMKNIDDAIHLAKEMVAIGTGYGRETIAIVSNMDEPLGKAIGNSLEIKEAIKTLKGNGPEDLFQLTLQLGTKLLLLAKKVEKEEEAKKLLKEIIDSGAAYNKFKELVKWQGGDVNQIENPELLPKAKYIIEVKSEKEGYIKSLNAEEIGKCALKLGAGRETMDSTIDLSAGIILNKKVDDKVMVGETLAQIHTNDISKGKDVEEDLKGLFEIGEKNKKSKKLIYGLVTKDRVEIY